MSADGDNHPLAFRMGIIAFLINNITIGALWGSFSVLLNAVETRLGVNRELSTLSLSAITLVMAICAPLVGIMAARFSIRWITVAGTVMSSLGFLLLAVTTSYPLYIIAYAALLGPGMAVGVILPPTLVSRWFSAGRGRALGVINAPVVIALVPLVTTWTLHSFGLTSTYLLLAGLSGIAVAASLFIIDPTQETPSRSKIELADTDATSGSISFARLLREPRLWAISIAAVASTTGSVILSANMIPMAASWGFSPPLAAILLSVQSLIGIVGAILFGWIADRIGALLAMAIVLFNGAVLWSLLLLHPPFAILVFLIGLIGMHGAGALPILALVLSKTFGHETFSRAYGLSNLINLPFSVLCVPLAAIAYTQAGSYSAPIVGQIVFFGVAVILALLVRRSQPSFTAMSPKQSNTMGGVV